LFGVAPSGARVKLRCMSTDDPVKRSRHLVEQLKRSQIYRDYEQAFR
jgi:hypothetical protein